MFGAISYYMHLFRHPWKSVFVYMIFKGIAIIIMMYQGVYFAYIGFCNMYHYRHIVLNGTTD